MGNIFQRLPRISRSVHRRSITCFRSRPANGLLLSVMFISLRPRSFQPYLRSALTIILTVPMILRWRHQLFQEDFISKLSTSIRSTDVDRRASNLSKKAFVQFGSFLLRYRSIRAIMHRLLKKLSIGRATVVREARFNFQPITRKFYQRFYSAAGSR